MWVEEKGQQCEFCNVLGSEDLYVAGCFKIECNGCYIHGIFVNWDTCAVLLNCEKIVYRIYVIVQHKLLPDVQVFLAPFPTESIHYWLARQNIMILAEYV